MTTQEDSFYHYYGTQMLSKNHSHWWPSNKVRLQFDIETNAKKLSFHKWRSWKGWASFIYITEDSSNMANNCHLWIQNQKGRRVAKVKKQIKIPATPRTVCNVKIHLLRCMRRWEMNPHHSMLRTIKMLPLKPSIMGSLWCLWCSWEMRETAY